MLRRASFISSALSGSYVFVALDLPMSFQREQVAITRTNLLKLLNRFSQPFEFPTGFSTIDELSDTNVVPFKSNWSGQSDGCISRGGPNHHEANVGWLFY